MAGALEGTLPGALPGRQAARGRLLGGLQKLRRILQKPVSISANFATAAPNAPRRPLLGGTDEGTFRPDAGWVSSTMEIDMAETLWLLVVLGGPVIIAALLIRVLLRRRRLSRGERRDRRQATRELYEKTATEGDRRRPPEH